MTPEELTRIATELKAALWGQPNGQWRSIIITKINRLPAPYREAVEDLVISSFEAGERAAKPSWEQRLAAYERLGCRVGGSILVLLLLLIAIYFPNPTAFQLHIFQTLLAFSAAWLSTGLAGSLEMNLKVGPRMCVKACGALAIFYLVYSFVPSYISFEPERRLPPQNQKATP